MGAKLRRAVRRPASHAAPARAAALATDRAAAGLAAEAAGPAKPAQTRRRAAAPLTRTARRPVGAARPTKARGAEMVRAALKAAATRRVGDAAGATEARRAAVTALTERLARTTPFVGASARRRRHLAPTPRAAQPRAAHPGVTTGLARAPARRLDAHPARALKPRVAVEAPATWVVARAAGRREPRVDGAVSRVWRDILGWRRVEGMTRVARIGGGR